MLTLFFKLREASKPVQHSTPCVDKVSSLNKIMSCKLRLQTMNKVQLETISSFHYFCASGRTKTRLELYSAYFGSSNLSHGGLSQI